MRVLNAAQMRDADQRTSADIGLPSLVLMENAGRQVVRAIEDSFDDADTLSFAILCGKGNNGGDGFVVARHLLNFGGKPEVLLLPAKHEVKGHAAVNLAAAVKTVIPVTEVPTPAEWKKARGTVFPASVVVDTI